MSRRGAKAALALATSLALAGCGTSTPASPTTTAAGPETATTAAAPATPLRYVAIGDSYSSGEGTSATDAWPQQLATVLTGQGLPVTLVANAARPGWTAQLAIAGELPVARDAKPDVATVLIGTNDALDGVPPATFRAQLRTLLAGAAALTGDPGRVVVVSLPDFAVAPAVTRGPMASTAPALQKTFNAIVVDEAATARMAVADITPTSEAMATDPSLVVADGLHPSVTELQAWTQVIAPVAKKAWSP